MFLVVNAGGKEAYVILAGMELRQDNRQKNYQYHLVLTSQVSLHQEKFYFFFLNLARHKYLTKTLIKSGLI